MTDPHPDRGDSSSLRPVERTPAGRRRACPRCGSRSIARIQYGYPAWSEDLDRRMASGEVRLGGCVVHSFQPDLACNSCGCTFDRNGTIIEPGA